LISGRGQGHCAFHAEGFDQFRPYGLSSRVIGLTHSNRVEPLMQSLSHYAALPDKRKIADRRIIRSGRTASVPEPDSLALLGVAPGALALSRRRNKHEDLTLHSGDFGAPSPFAATF
jgi:hypothetical protein